MAYFARQFVSSVLQPKIALTWKLLGAYMLERLGLASSMIWILSTFMHMRNKVEASDRKTRFVFSLKGVRLEFLFPNLFRYQCWQRIQQRRLGGFAGQGNMDI